MLLLLLLLLLLYMCSVCYIACDDARIRVWRIPDDGSRGGTQNEEELFLIGTIITSQHTYSTIKPLFH